MLRRVQLSVVALVCAVAGVMALPAGGAQADVVPPTVEIISNPAPGSDGVVTCELGDSYVLLTASNLDNPTGGGDSYEWDSPFGQRSGPDEKTYWFRCDFEGSLTVSLTITNIMGYSGSATVTVRSNLAPIVKISVDGQPVQGSIDLGVGASVTLDGTKSYDPEGDSVSFEWQGIDYPVPSASGESTLTVTCGPPGRFGIILLVTDELGFEGIGVVYVNCLDSVDASFRPEPAVPGQRTPIPVGTTITFEPTNPGAGSTWEWRTTGVRGVASVDAKFERTFNKPGDYGVQLTETGPSGTATRWVGYTVVAPPTVSVSPAPASMTGRMTIATGTRLTFDGSGSRSHNGGALAYQWRTTGVRGVAADSPSYARRFDTAGNFGVELTVTDSLGQKTKRWVGLTVVTAKPPVASVSPAPPNPSKRMEVKLGSTVTFNGKASVDPDGGVLTYQWRTTGVRGVASKTDTYTRRFGQVGNFGVELTVIDDEGQTAKRWVGVTVVR